jgi:5-hydroxyisourate hydrolase
MSHVTTHVLDAAMGRPAEGVPVTLFGRIASLGPDTLPPGAYRLVFDTGAWFGGAPHFFPLVTIDFLLSDAVSHYHVPLLLSPFAYSTYRGS